MAAAGEEDGQGAGASRPGGSGGNEADADAASEGSEAVWCLLAGCVEDLEDEGAATAMAAAREAAAEASTSSSTTAMFAAAATSAATPAQAETLAEAPPPAEAPAAVPAAPPATPPPGPLAPPPRRGWRQAARGPRVPAEILEDPRLTAAVASALPRNYEFEVPRTIWRLRKAGARHVGLQLPEGLTRFATALADIIQDFVPTVETVTILGDVCFGACCIDDLAGQAVGVDFLVHYGHSVLVPTDQTTLLTLYVHVEIDVDVAHLVETVRLNFGPEKRLTFMGSVQFTSGIAEATAALKKEAALADEDGGGSGAARVPQVRPLGPGETLGCTSAHVAEDCDAVVFVCDGRFHLESAMIQNPHVKDGFFRYDPFAKTLTREGYGHAEMHTSRRAAIEVAKGAKCVGLILGTLGRQGSSGVLEGVERLLVARGLRHLTLLLSEVSPERLALFRGVDAWVQVACPRLSLDWGDAFGAPLLTPYEAHVAFGGESYKDVYPMDYYSNRGGPWSNYGAHSGHGGSVSEKFRHLKRHRQRQHVGYEEEPLVVAAAA